MPNLSLVKKILNAALVLLIASFVIEIFVSFPYSEEIDKCLQKLVIPFMTLLINISEKQVEPNIINDGIQGNNDNSNENANDLANEGNNEEAIPPEPNNEENANQLNQIYD
jgi:c-di-AMP phosphodiesterase-like protein